MGMRVVDIRELDSQVLNVSEMRPRTGPGVNPVGLWTEFGFY